MAASHRPGLDSGPDIETTQSDRRAATERRPTPASLENHGSAGLHHQSQVAPRTAWPWKPSVVGLWLLGAGAWWVAVARNTRRFRLLLRSVQPAPVDLKERASRVAAQLGLARVPEIGIVTTRIPPMLWAAMGGRPRLVLPGELWERLDDHQKDAVLAHELAHLRRGDHWVRRLEALACGLYWWDPVAWWVRREVERAEERCCDAWVLWACRRPPGRMPRRWS